MAFAGTKKLKLSNPILHSSMSFDSSAIIHLSDEARSLGVSAPISNEEINLAIFHSLDKNFCAFAILCSEHLKS